MANELITEVSKLIVEGKGELLSQAVRMIQDGSMEEILENVLMDDEEECGETMKEKTILHPLTDALTSLNPMLELLSISRPIPVIPLLTNYGHTLLVDLTRYDYKAVMIDILFEADNLMILPVHITEIPKEIPCGEKYTTEALHYERKYNYECVEYGLIIPRKNIKDEKTFEIDTTYVGMGAISINIDDMHNAILSLINLMKNKGQELMNVI